MFPIIKTRLYNDLKIKVKQLKDVRIFVGEKVHANLKRTILNHVKCMGECILSLKDLRSVHFLKGLFNYIGLLNKGFQRLK